MPLDFFPVCIHTTSNVCFISRDVKNRVLASFCNIDTKLIMKCTNEVMANTLQFA